MSAAPDVLSPAKLGPLTLRNRTIKAATFEGRSPDALVSDDLIEFHRQVAAGGVGMTTVAYCAVSPGGRASGNQMWMRPEAVPGLRRLTDAIHAEGAAVSAQIAHAGPVANAAANDAPALAPVGFMNPAANTFTKEATREDIDEVAAQHATAARLAVDAGFDALEVHLGHNYLASAFLSPRINTRDDEFGGSLENRAKVARELVMAVREAVEQLGAQVAITTKLNIADGVRGGISVEESLTTAKWLEADGGLDAIELTAGSSFVNPMYTFRGDPPTTLELGGKNFYREYPYHEAYLLDDAKLFRAELSMPLILLGGITNRDTMDLAMAAGFEFVAMGRALLAEPDLINKIKADRTVKSVCTHNNQCVLSIYSRTRCVVTGAPDQKPG